LDLGCGDRNDSGDILGGTVESLLSDVEEFTACQSESDDVTVVMIQAIV
jgi:hypothetical protein